MNNMNEYLPHGFCIAWNQQLLAMHVISDLLIALAYFSIPIGIVYVARKRPDAVLQPIYYLFAAFILACGVTHVMGIVTLWIPLYYAQGVTKILTALVSVITAIYLLPKLKVIMSLPDLAKLTQLNKELAIEIESRKKSEVSLKESQAVALQAQKTQAAFLANMSHEIRTPMNGVLGTVDLLLDTALTDAQHKLATASKRSAKSLLALLNDILDISKVESGKLVLREEEVQLTEIFEDVASALTFDAERKGLELVCPANNLPEGVFLADSVRIRQILVNLVGNAIKFTEHGFVTVSCRELGRSDRIAALELRIKDSGVGIDPRDQENLFQRFTQLDNSSTRRAQGSGLGLAIVKELVHLMEGTLQLFSQPGVGTEIVVNLNLTLAQADSAKTEETWSSPFSGTVHVAMTEAHTLPYVIGLIGGWGYACRVIKSSDDFEFPAHVFKPGDVLIVSSLYLKTNEQLLAKLQEHAVRSGVRVLLLIKQSEQTRNELLNASWLGRAVSKPLMRQELLNALKALTGAEEMAIRPTVDQQNQARPRYMGRVLVVEDSPMNQMVICKVLQSIGIETSVANHGAEALELLQGIHFDAVLMDGQMPVMDGYETTQKIRSGGVPGVNRDIPVIALTAHAMSGEDQKCYNAGMSDYLTKPLDRIELCKVLDKYLTRS